jgi:hypothetical protein
MRLFINMICHSVLDTESSKPNLRTSVRGILDTDFHRYEITLLNNLAI